MQNQSVIKMLIPFVVMMSAVAFLSLPAYADQMENDAYRDASGRPLREAGEERRKSREKKAKTHPDADYFIVMAEMVGPNPNPPEKFPELSEEEKAMRENASAWRREECRKHPGFWEKECIKFFNEKPKAHFFQACGKASLGLPPCSASMTEIPEEK